MDTAQPTATRRDALLAEHLEATPSWYSPWVHLGFPLVVGLGLIAASVALIRDLHPAELLMLPLMWILSNATEWRLHRDLLHKRVPFLTVFFDGHTSPGPVRR